jgi:anti-sigma-K factor RskA
VNERQRSLLEAYRDGELSWLGRRRVQRWLRRDPHAQRELESLETLGALLRDADAEAPAPDLWPAIRLRLAEADLRAEAPVRARFWRSAAGYLTLGAVAASAAGLALLLAGEEPRSAAGPPGAVRWIDSRGHPMLVLRDDPGATIIWVPEQSS